MKKYEHYWPKLIFYAVSRRLDPKPFEIHMKYFQNLFERHQVALL